MSGPKLVGDRSQGIVRILSLGSLLFVSVLAWLLCAPGLVASGSNGAVSATGDDPARFFLGVDRPGTGRVVSFAGSSENFQRRREVSVDWTEYVSRDGRVRPASGDLDGDGRAELVLGLNDAGNGRLQIRDDASNGHAHMDWVEVNWPSYREQEGETRPACGDVDGDGRDEMIVGLGNASGGWMEVIEDASEGFSHRDWIRVRWSRYNRVNGRTRPAAGDFDGDDRDEIAVGLDRPSGGFMEVFDDAGRDYAHRRWVQINWSSYAFSGGGTRPAAGDLDGDGMDELVAGMDENGNGWLEVFDDPAGRAHHLDWFRLEWSEYNDDHGATRPSAGDLDDDGRDEVLLCTTQGGDGWAQLRDDRETDYESLAWRRPEQAFSSYHVPWFWESTNLTELLPQEQPGTGKQIAVVGTGISPDIGALNDRVTGTGDFLQTDGETFDDVNGHDTQIAGLLAGTLPDIQGPGIVPGASLVSERLTTATGHTKGSMLAKGIRDAADRGVDVILIPMGNPQPNPSVGNAISYARGKGCVLVASAGNGGGNKTFYPARRDEVISVVAHDRRDVVGAATNASLEADVAAPGTKLHTVSPVSTEDQALSSATSGSSAAAGLVAGVVARLLQEKPDLTLAEIRGVLKGGRRRMLPKTYTRFFGYGALDAERSMRLARSERPDVAVEDVRFVPEQPRPEAPVSLSFLVRNRGIRGASSINLYVRQFGTGWINDRLDSDALSDLQLKPGEKRRITLQLEDAPDRNTWFLVYAGSSGDDYSFWNNVRWAQVRPTSDVKRRVDTTDLSYRVLGEQGERVRAEWTFQNKGNVGEPNIHLKGSVSGERVLSGEGIELAPGEKRTVSVSWGYGDQDRPKSVMSLRAEPSGTVKGVESPPADLVRFRFLHLPGNNLYKTNYVDTAGQDMIVDVPWRMGPNRESLPFLFYAGSLEWDHAYPAFFRLFGGGQHDDVDLGTVSYRDLVRSPQEIYKSVYTGTNTSINFNTLDFETLDEQGDFTNEFLPDFESQNEGSRWPISKGENNGYHRVLRIPRGVVESFQSSDARSVWLRARVTRFVLPVKTLSKEELAHQIENYKPSSKRYEDEDKYQEVVLNKDHHPDDDGFIIPRNHSQVFHVYMADEPFPRLEDVSGTRYYDGHFHSIAEWSTEDYTDVAPRKQHGGPLVMAVEASRSIGLIGGLSGSSNKISLRRENHKEHVVSTDHNVFFDDEHSPDVGPTAHSHEREYLETRQDPRGLGTTAGQEVTLFKEELKNKPGNMGAHMLAYDFRRIPGVFHGGLGLGGASYLGHNHNNVLRVLSGRREAGEGDWPWERSAFAAHPWVSPLKWSESMMKRATGREFMDKSNYATQFGKEKDHESGEYSKFFYKDVLTPRDAPRFSGIQVWNGRSTYSQSDLAQHQFARMDPWMGFLDNQITPNEKYGYSRLRKNLDRWYRWMWNVMRIGVDRDHVSVDHPKKEIWTIRKLYGVGGTDAHGDFNYTRNYSPFSKPIQTDAYDAIAEALKRSPSPVDRMYGNLLDRTSLRDVMEVAGIEFGGMVESNAYGRVRTLTFPEGDNNSKDLRFHALKKGRAIMTDGIVFRPYVDAQRKWDNDNLRYNDQLPPGEKGYVHREGEMGGGGKGDGSRTVIIPRAKLDESSNFFRYRPEPTLHTKYTTFSRLVSMFPYLEVHALIRGSKNEGNYDPKTVSKVLPHASGENEGFVYLPLPDKDWESKTVAYNSIMVQGGETDPSGEKHFYAPDQGSGDSEKLPSARSVAVANPIYAAMANYIPHMSLKEKSSGFYINGAGTVRLPISLYVPNGEVLELEAGFKQIGSDGITLGEEKDVEMYIEPSQPRYIRWAMDDTELKSDEGYSITRSKEMKEKYKTYSGVIYLKEQPKDAWGNKLNKFALPVEVRGESKGH